MNILLVEDMELIARSMIRVLKSRGHDVLWVQSVPDALAVLRPDTAFDVVLLDREVGQDDGWSLRSSVPEGTRVVLMTGNPPEGAPPHFLKGSSIKVLLAMLDGRQPEAEP